MDENNTITDLVIPFRSSGNNLSLQFALRSIARHMSAVKNVFIIGDNPLLTVHHSPFTIHHSPFSDNHPPADKEKNIFEKICYACKQSAISDNFWLSNDDVFLLAPMQQEAPQAIKGNLADSLNTNYSTVAYKTAIANTYHWLRKRGYSTWHFDTHHPIIYNKEKFLKACQLPDWSVSCGYVIKSLYGNINSIKTARKRDIKFSVPAASEAAIEKITSGQLLFSIAPQALNNHMLNFLEKQYQ